MSTPLTYDDVRGLKADGDLGRFIKEHMAAARRLCTYRRALVLRYDDLAQKLEEPPIGFKRADQWNGFIPPATWNQALNTTPCRPALLALVVEAERRNHAAQEAAG